MLRNNERNIKLDQAKFMGMGPLSGDFKFNSVGWEIRKNYDSLVGYVTETRTERWPRASELEIPGLPQFTVEEGIQKLRDIRMLEWICHLRPTHPS